jgi:hypothetical protein
MPYEPETFKDVMDHPMMKEAFKQYQTGALALNNVGFCDAVDGFKAEAEGMSEEQVRVKARQVYGDYVKDGTDRMVNLPSHTQRETEDSFSRIGGMNKAEITQMFDKARHETFEMMRKDNYPRFKTSPEYKNAMAEIKKIEGLQARVDQLKNPSLADKMRAMVTDGGIDKMRRDAELALEKAVETSPINPKINTNDKSANISQFAFEADLGEQSRGRSAAVTEKEQPKVSVRKAMEGQIGVKPSGGPKVGPQVG